MEIKLPKHTRDLRISHYKALRNPVYDGEMDISLIAKFLSEFSGVDENLIKKIDVTEVVKMYNHAVDVSASFEMGKPQQEVTVNGIDYYLINPDKVSTGWHIDFGNTDVDSEFTRLACLFYYPKGGTYGDVDKNSNLLHPIHERYEDFKEHFPMVTFLNAAGFFLHRFKKSIDKSMEIRKMEIRIRLLMRGISGRSLLTSSVKDIT